MRWLLLLAALWGSDVWPRSDPLTPLKEANYLSLPDSHDIDQYLFSLAADNKQARMVALGHSAGGRPLHGLLISASPAFLQHYQPEPDKATVLVLAAQHGNEPAGAEAVQQLASEFAAGRHQALLERLNLVLVAMANPDGRDLARRHNANNDNTNIDYVAMNAGETRLLVNALHTFDPDLVYDAHESGIWKRVLTRQQGWLTDVEVQFEAGNNPNIDARLQDYTSGFLLPALIKQVNEAGLRAERYRGEITSLEQQVARGGLGITNLRNYAAMQGRVSVLVESRLDNKGGDYVTPRNIAERVSKQYLALFSLLQLAAEDSERLIRVSRQARRHWQSAGSGRTLSMDVHFTRNEAQPEVSIPLVRQADGQRRYHVFANHDAIIAKGPVSLPPAYAITRERERMARWLQRHHIRFTTVRAPQVVHAGHIRITDVMPQPRVKPGVREKWRVQADTQAGVVTLGPGDLLVPMAQPLGPLAALMLDPRSANALYQEEGWHWLMPGRFPVFPVSPGGEF